MLNVKDGGRFNHLETSTSFRQSNQILFSAKILRAAEARQAGVADGVSAGPSDVIDLNHSGKVQLEAQGDGKVLTADQPSIVSPKLDKLEAYAKSQGSDLVTQADIPEGVFISDRSVNRKDGKALDAPVKSLNMLVNDLPDKFDPNARFALDFHTGELLVYKPAPGGVVDNLTTTPSGLQYGIIKEGTGEPVKSGQLVAVGYGGWLQNGKKFDSNEDLGGKPFIFQVGNHSVIAGWDEGVAGMKVGETRRLVIPPNLGYGERGAGDDIPPNSTLIFNVSLKAYKDPDPPAAAPPAEDARTAS